MLPASGWLWLCKRSHKQHQVPSILVETWGKKPMLGSSLSGVPQIRAAPAGSKSVLLPALCSFWNSKKGAGSEGQAVQGTFAFLHKPNSNAKLCISNKYFPPFNLSSQLCLLSYCLNESKQRWLSSQTRASEEVSLLPGCLGFLGRASTSGFRD